MAATSRICACLRFVGVEDLFRRTTLIASNGLPLVAIHIPKIGQLSRKERDDLKAYGQERGLRVFDDMKRLERDFAVADGTSTRAHRSRRRTIC